MADRCDVVVIGGGPAGCVTAMLLARRGCSVVILDSSRPGAFCVGETLPPQATQLLADLNLLETFQAQRHRSSPGVVSLWGSSEPLATDFIFSRFGHGWHIDRLKFNAMMAEAATDAGVELAKAIKIENCTEEKNGWRVRVAGSEGDRDLNCRLIVDAAGRRPTCAFGFPRRKVFDTLIAVAGLNRPTQGRCVSDYTLIEAVDQGWFYSALLPSGDYIVAYMTDADIYAVGCRSSRAFLETQLAKARHTLERIEHRPTQLSHFCAMSTIRDNASRANWLAVGDAARSYDPLSGAGLVTTMKMAFEATEVIVDMLHGNRQSALEYNRANHAAFQQYRKAYGAYYGLEGRWPESEFWARRRSIVS